MRWGEWTLDLDIFKRIREGAAAVETAAASWARLKVPSELLDKLGRIVRRGRFTNPRILFAAAAPRNRAALFRLAEHARSRP